MLWKASQLRNEGFVQIFVQYLTAWWKIHALFADERTFFFLSREEFVLSPNEIFDGSVLIKVLIWAELHFSCFLLACKVVWDLAKLWLLPKVVGPRFVVWQNFSPQERHSCYFLAFYFLFWGKGQVLEVSRFKPPAVFPLSWLAGCRKLLRTRFCLGSSKHLQKYL